MSWGVRKMNWRCGCFSHSSRSVCTAILRYVSSMKTSNSSSTRNLRRRGRHSSSPRHAMSVGKGGAEERRPAALASWSARAHELVGALGSHTRAPRARPPARLRSLAELPHGQLERQSREGALAAREVARIGGA
eukprot:scaffold307656_cov24-Tisochrysis_lutea.AAC.2